MRARGEYLPSGLFAQAPLSTFIGSGSTAIAFLYGRMHRRLARHALVYDFRLLRLSSGPASRSFNQGTC